jgi:hypothetical protein
LWRGWPCGRRGKDGAALPVRVPCRVYSRIQGDLERDYNDFVIDQTYFSQGPGNFSDKLGWSLKILIPEGV